MLKNKILAILRIKNIRTILDSNSVNFRFIICAKITIATISYKFKKDKYQIRDLKFKILTNINNIKFNNIKYNNLRFNNLNKIMLTLPNNSHKSSIIKEKISI